MNRELIFADFSEAANFLKKIRIGKIQRKENTDFFIWDSESASLTEEHKSIIEEVDGSIFVWKDNEIGLTWLLKEHITPMDIKQFNAICYGGHNDWREPSLRELKTLSSSKKNRFGGYVKEGLENKISGNYRSCTPHHHWTESAWWNFDYGQSTTEEYSEGKIKWNSEGNYAGFEKDVVHNSARMILVRGVETHYLSDWAIWLRDWSEKNKLFNFPATQKNIEELDSLNINDVTPPIYISRLPKLKYISCCANQEIEDVVFSIINLEALTLEKSYDKNKHQLKEIPASIQKLYKLASLSVRDIGLNKIDKAIGSLTKLQHLDLSNNQIDLIPDSLGNLRNLKSLNLSLNPIVEIPNSIGQLNNLEEFYIDGQFEQLPDSIGHLSKLKKAIIRSDKLTEIPNSIGNLNDLEELSIDGGFEYLPDSIGHLSKLKNIIIRSEKLTDIPNELCNISKLESLLCRAPLRKFAHDLDKLESIKSIEIENAFFESIPDRLYSMPWLRTLRISNTPIKHIFDKISGMTNLERLDLWGTQITELPKSILKLENLCFLNISNTNIDTLPEWLNDMKSLSRIGCEKKKFPTVLIKKYVYIHS